MTKLENWRNPVSPHTGKEMEKRSKETTMQYHGESYTTTFDYLWCKDSNEEYTTTALDSTNMQRVYRLEAERYTNTLVIADWKVCRLVGLTDDNYDEWNNFYICDPMMGDKLEYVCNLMGVTFLKNRIPNDEYDRLVRMWNLNNTHPIRNFDSEDYTIILVEGQEYTLELESKLRRKRFYTDKSVALHHEGNNLTGEIKGFTDSASFFKLNLSKFPELKSIEKI